MSNEPLITKYRPRTFEEVLGHDEQVEALKRRLDADNRPHAFLLTGPSGVGKTTLARIIGDYLKAEVFEIDAGSSGSIETIRELIDHGQHLALSGARFKMFIIDECFSPETLINTPNGSQRIDSLKVGDFVQGALGPAKVSRVFKNAIALPRIMQLCLSDGSTILCTKDHAFLTERGWIPACELVHGTRTLSTSEAKKNPHLLRMWDLLYELGRGAAGPMPALLETSVYAKLSRLWDKIHGRSYSLLANLRQQNSWTETNWTYYPSPTGSLRRGPASIRGDRSRKGNSREVFSENANAQSYAHARGAREDDGNKTSQWDAHSKESLARREWSANARIHNSAADSCRRYFGVHCINQFLARSRTISTWLQDRFGFSDWQVGGRDRRRYSPLREAAKIGYQERAGVADVRVARVTRPKQGYFEKLRRDGLTYRIGEMEFTTYIDLEIEDHPSYNVGGLVVHNCHGVSGPGKQALLKLIEEPPEHLFIALCTTEVHRVPDTWKTRCYQIPLRAVKPIVIEDLLSVICDLEGWKPDPDVFQAIVQGATGQPRKAISLLESLHDAPSKEEAKRVMALLEDSDPVLELGRLLVQGASWQHIQPALQRIDDTEFDGALIPLTRFVMSALLREANVNAAGRLSQIVQALTFPINTFDPKAAFVTAICRVLWPT